MPPSFAFIDLFAGLGGFHLAASDLGGECVFASELQSDLRELYLRNFGIEAAGDINEVSISDIPAHDLLCAGFPCQPFSKAGSQLGWRDAVRGTVFFRVVQILESHRPEFVLLENVAHFVRHDEGNTYRRVCEALGKLGYDVQHKQLSPHKFGVPQVRERMYLVGRLRSKGGLSSFNWPANEAGVESNIASILDVHPLDARPVSRLHLDVLEVWQEFLDLIPKGAKLPYFPIWSCEFGATYPYGEGPLESIPLSKLREVRGSFGQRLEGRTKRELLSGVPPYALRGEFPRWKREFIRQNREFYSEHQSVLKRWLNRVKRFDHSFQKFEWNCQGVERDIWNLIIQFRASGVRVKRPTTAPSLVAMTTSQVPIVGWERRYMTTRECARLQSMEDLRELPSASGRAFKALGNAVNVAVVTQVLRSLMRSRSEVEEAA